MMTDTDTDIETTREAIADDEMHASHHLNNMGEIDTLWHLCDSQQEQLDSLHALVIRLASALNTVLPVPIEIDS
jgi:hypothetical protein